MPDYKPPLDDIRFVLNDVLKASNLNNEIPSYEDADSETVNGMLDVVADFVREVIYPLNQKSDNEPCEYDPKTQSVKTTEGFKEAHEGFVGLGLLGLTADPKDGGMGMPNYLGIAINEMMCTNVSYATLPALTGGAYKAVKKFGSDELKDTYLHKLMDGTWSGTMCLTEPHCGTDLGLMRTKAQPNKDGSFTITGNKIFITHGEQDITENICHLVLGRIPGAPEGIKGISLFMVPKFLPDSNGQAGYRNEAYCTGLEEKMGIHGCPTASMSFDGAKGWLIGKPNKGMSAMFAMMNDARLKAGTQGLGLAELAYQNIATYASERVQGAALKDANNPKAKSTEIINHANIKKNLLDMKSQIEGARAMIYETAIEMDKVENHPNKEVRDNSNEYAALMTPVLKSCITDLSVDTSLKAMQLHGGTGYITETGVEQFLRDAIIGTIYEGTNDIQSIDFTFRKVMDPKDLGYRLGLFMNPLAIEIDAAKQNNKISNHAETLEKAMGTFQETTMGLLQQGMSGQLDDILVHSRDFMDMFGKLAMGRMWLKMMDAAQSKLDLGAKGKTAEFYEHKLELGEYYLNRIMMPEIKKLEMRIEAGSATAVKVKTSNLVPGDELGIASEENSKDNGGKLTPNI